MMMEAICPGCGKTFTPARRNQSYCSRECQKAATAHAARGDRTKEYASRPRVDYDRAMWLHQNVREAGPIIRGWFIQTMLEAASDHDGALRAILLDLALLRAAPEHDNIAKLVQRFCWANYGTGTRDTIMDDGKPAKRKFVGDRVAEEQEGPNPDGTMQGPYAPIEVQGEVLGDDPAWLRIRGDLRGRMTDRRVGNRTKPVTGDLEPSAQDIADLARVDRIVAEAQAKVDALGLEPIQPHVPPDANAHVIDCLMLVRQPEERRTKEGTVPWQEWWARRAKERAPRGPVIREPVGGSIPREMPTHWASGRSMRAQAAPLPPCLTGKLHFPPGVC